jgi:hypothetical protein
MAVLLMEREAGLRLWCEEGGGPSLEGSGPSLDDLLSGAWDGLTAAASAVCPVCRGDLVPRWSAGAGVVGGRCRDCGSELS